MAKVSREGISLHAQHRESRLERSRFNPSVANLQRTEVSSQPR
jgi:hypothetical protein